MNKGVARNCDPFLLPKIYFVSLQKYTYMPPKKKPYSQLSKTAKFYRNNPGARKKKAATDKKVNARPEQKKKRRESGRARTAAKKKGQNIEGKDYDHKQGRFISSKANRGQAEKSRLKGSKRKKRTSKKKK